MVSFILQPLYLGERVLGILEAGRFVIPRAGLHAEPKKIDPCPAGNRIVALPSTKSSRFTDSAKKPVGSLLTSSFNILERDFLMGRRCVTMMNIRWCIDPLLGKDLETNNETAAVAM
jgi:hypothetical protein